MKKYKITIEISEAELHELENGGTIGVSPEDLEERKEINN